MAARKKAARKRAATVTRKKAPKARNLSAKGRRAISAANKARWAKYRATKSYNLKRKLLGGDRQPKKAK